MAFNILDQVRTKTLESRNSIESIDIDSIDFNENNFFSMDTERVEALSEEIINVGFRSVVELRKMENNRYMMIAGETRARAMRMAYENTGDEKFKYIPAVISTMNDIEAKQRLITDELLKRNHTPYEKMQAVELLQNLYNEQKKAGEKLPKRIQYLIAESLNIGKTQVGTYQKVINNAIPEVKELMKKDLITLENAKDLASLSDEEQAEYLDVASDFTKQEIDEYKESLGKNQMMFDERNEIVAVEDVSYDEDEEGIEDEAEYDGYYEADQYEELEDEDNTIVNNHADEMALTHKKTIDESLHVIVNEFAFLSMKMSEVGFNEERKLLASSENAIDQIFELLKLVK